MKPRLNPHIEHTNTGSGWLRNTDLGKIQSKFQSLTDTLEAETGRASALLRSLHLRWVVLIRFVLNPVWMVELEGVS